MRGGALGFHPAINLVYFALVLGFTMFFLHPACLAVSLLGGWSFALCLRGRRALRLALRGMLPLLVFTAVLNPAFNHAGITVLTYLPSGNPLTLESVYYGLAAAALLCGALGWFYCINCVMTSDQFVCLFGRAFPALGLMLSMALHLVPGLFERLRQVSAARRHLGRPRAKGILAQMREGVKVCSIVVTWSLEGAIETADAMKGRGYGLPGRTSFSLYRFTRRDRTALAVLALLGGVVAAAGWRGAFDWRYFPAVQGGGASLYQAGALLAYFCLSLLPVLVLAREGWIWHRLQWRT